ncbi:hypothetical protein LJC55_01395 [Eubacteriales bacterium OttesenSCG-928-N14]|nr:hypothetical protein [Eubacteriales bacterium OttesenSCG-928-N14]
MNVQQMKISIIDTITDLFNINDNSILKTSSHLPLTSKEVGLSDIALTYLFFELENKFGVVFQEEDIVNYGLASVDSILSLMQENNKEPNFETME